MQKKSRLLDMGGTCFTRTDEAARKTVIRSWKATASSTGRYLVVNPCLDGSQLIPVVLEDGFFVEIDRDEESQNGQGKVYFFMKGCFVERHTRPLEPGHFPAKMDAVSFLRLKHQKQKLRSYEFH